LVTSLLTETEERISGAVCHLRKADGLVCSLLGAPICRYKCALCRFVYSKFFRALQISK